MVVVNYFVLAELFSLLERVELSEGVAMLDFDPDVESDVWTIAQQFIMPAVSEASDEGRDAIAQAIAFYSQHGKAPFQLMKDRCHELTLPDAKSWPLFFHRIGIAVLGASYRDRYGNVDFYEHPDEQEGAIVLTRR